MGKYSTGADYASAAKSMSGLSVSVSGMNFDSLSGLFKNLGKSGISAASQKNLLLSLGRAFDTLDVDNLKRVMNALRKADVAKKIMGDIPVDQAASIMKKLDANDAVLILRKMPVDPAADILKKMTDVDASKILGKLPDSQATAIASKMGKRFNIDTKTLVAGAAVVGVGIYIDKKLQEADEDIEECENTCLPSNWAEYKYGDLEKSKLAFSEVKSTNDQPICTKNISDCGEYCTKTCTDIHEYELPGTDLTKKVTDTGKNTITKLLETLNPFNKDGIFGNTGWISIVCCILVIVGIILSSTM